MTDTFRALCAELLEELDLSTSWHDALELKVRAKAELAQSEAEGPSDEELLEAAAKALGYKHIPSDETCLTAEASELLAFARAVLARWGRPTPEPVPAPEEVTELVAWLRDHALNCRELGRNDWAERSIRAAALLEQSPVALEPVPASERLPYLADCDAEGLFWGWNADSLSWELIHLKLFNNQFANIYPFWLPYWDLPCPIDTSHDH